MGKIFTTDMTKSYILLRNIGDFGCQRRRDEQLKKKIGKDTDVYFIGEEILRNKDTEEP